MEMFQVSPLVVSTCENNAQMMFGGWVKAVLHHTVTVISLPEFASCRGTVTLKGESMFASQYDSLHAFHLWNKGWTLV